MSRVNIVQCVRKRWRVISRSILKCVVERDTAVISVASPLTQELGELPIRRSVKEKHMIVIFVGSPSAQEL